MAEETNAVFRTFHAGSCFLNVGFEFLSAGIWATPTITWQIAAPTRADQLQSQDEGDS